MGKIGLVICLTSISLLSGCAHQASVSKVTATNIYTNVDSKIQGETSFVIDPASLSQLKRDNAIQGFICSAHRYPVDATDSFVASLPTMMNQVFESVQQVSTPTRDDRLNLVFRIERFEPRLRFNQGFWTASADATVELAVSVTGTRGSERVLGTTVDSQRSKTGDGGGFCEGGGLVLGDATRDALKDVLEKLGERIANSPAVRSPAGTLGSGSTRPVQQSGDRGKLSVQDAQAKCAELGLKRGTEDYARCVVRLGR